MRALHAIAGFILFFELPIPIFWLMIHPLNSFWRNKVRAAYWVATPAAWICGGALLWTFRGKLLASEPPSLLAGVAGAGLICAEIYLFARAERELGSKRLVGHAELTGTGELSTVGMYSHVRHPRYTGMLCAVAGAGLLAGSRTLWYVAAIWWLLALAVIRLEERELIARFGPSYVEYRRRVPAFLPFRLVKR